MKTISQILAEMLKVKETVDLLCEDLGSHGFQNDDMYIVEAVGYSDELQQALTRAITALRDADKTVQP